MLPSGSGTSAPSAPCSTGGARGGRGARWLAPGAAGRAILPAGPPSNSRRNSSHTDADGVLGRDTSLPAAFDEMIRWSPGATLCRTARGVQRRVQKQVRHGPAQSVCCRALPRRHRCRKSRLSAIVRHWPRQVRRRGNDDKEGRQTVRASSRLALGAVIALVSGLLLGCGGAATREKVDLPDLGLTMRLPPRWRVDRRSPRFFADTGNRDDGPLRTGPRRPTRGRA